MDKSLEELYDGPEQEVEESPVVEEAKAEPAKAERDEQGRFAKTGEEAGSPPEPLDHAAIVGERRRRQEAEARETALKAQLEAIQNPPEPPPSIWEDEEGARMHDRNQAVAEAVQRATMQSQLAMSEMLASQKHDDFDDMKASFLALAEKNPVLAEQALAHKHPWEKAYQIAKSAAEMAELGATDVASMREKIREEERAKLLAEGDTQRLPPTLSGQRNVGSRAAPAWNGLPSLTDLYD